MVTKQSPLLLHCPDEKNSLVSQHQFFSFFQIGLFICIAVFNFTKYEILNYLK